MRVAQELPKMEAVKKQQKLVRMTLPKRQLPITEPVYRIEVLYKDNDFIIPRLRYDNNLLGGLFIESSLFCPRLKDGEYTFAFTNHGIAQFMPVIKKWLTDTDRFSLSYCELFIYEIVQTSKVVFSDKTQVAYKGKFQRKLHELVTRIMVVKNPLHDQSI
jgi:hypothetical protein